MPKTAEVKLSKSQKLHKILILIYFIVLVIGILLLGVFLLNKFFDMLRYDSIDPYTLRSIIILFGLGVITILGSIFLKPVENSIQRKIFEIMLNLGLAFIGTIITYILLSDFYNHI